jgi:HK97 family phage prohead protease
MAKAIEGYASVFYAPGDKGSEYWLAHDVSERVMPGAFDRTLSSSAEVAALWNHNPDFLLGSRSARTLRLSTDAKGLKYSIDYNPDDPQHETVYQKLLRGDIPGSSFSFTIRKENVRRVDGGFVRELLDVNLIEISPVWRPAYQSSTALARGASVRDWYDKNPVQRRLTELQRSEAEAVQVRLRLVEINN